MSTITSIHDNAAYARRAREIFDAMYDEWKVPPRFRDYTTLFGRNSAMRAVFGDDFVEGELMPNADMSRIRKWVLSHPHMLEHDFVIVEVTEASIRMTYITPEKALAYASDRVDRITKDEFDALVEAGVQFVLSEGTRH